MIFSWPCEIKFWVEDFLAVVLRRKVANLFGCSRNPPAPMNLRSDAERCFASFRTGFRCVLCVSSCSEKRFCVGGARRAQRIHKEHDGKTSACNLSCIFLGRQCLNGSIRIELQFRHFHIAQMRFAAQLCVVIKQPPLAVFVDDGMMRRPTVNRI